MAPLNPVGKESYARDAGENCVKPDLQPREVDRWAGRP